MRVTRLLIGITIKLCYSGKFSKSCRERQIMFLKIVGEYRSCRMWNKEFIPLLNNLNLKEKTAIKLMREKEKISLTSIFLSPTKISSILKTNFNSQITLILLAANAFNLGCSEFLPFCKELRF